MGADGQWPGVGLGQVPREPVPPAAASLHPLRLRLLSGTRAGATFVGRSRLITVGRQADADLRFDPERELCVTARHAIIFLDHDGWYVRDLGSTNGTLLNGRLISQDTRLRNGDRLVFGVGGPTAEFISRAPSDAEVTPPRPLAQLAATAARDEKPDTGERVRLAVNQRTRRSSYMAAGVAVLAITVAGLSMLVSERRRGEFERERTAMRLQIDSLQWAGAQAVSELEVHLASLTDALRASEERVRSLEAAVRQAESEGAVGRARDLRAELADASDELVGRQQAALLDFRVIQSRVRPAVAKIFVESQSGEVVTGSAFAVRPDATILTARHVISGPSGNDTPRRIAIQFADSEQVWPARVLATSVDSDLALVKVDNILGAVPFVQRLNLRGDTLSSGAPLAMIGFPLGGESPPANARNAVARPLLSAGILRAWNLREVEVVGYGAVGSSGSPVLDENGELIAVVFGGVREGGVQAAILAVPATSVARLLSGNP